MESNYRDGPTGHKKEGLSNTGNYLLYLYFITTHSSHIH